MSRIDVVPSPLVAPEAVASARLRRPRSGRWWLAVSSIAIAVTAPLPYLTSSLTELAADGQEIAANYVHRPGWVRAVFLVHIVVGGVALLVLPLQLSTRLRDRVPAVHRAVGRLALGAILIAAAAGGVLAPFSRADEVAGFGLLAIGWFVCAVACGTTIRRGDVDAHRRWAIRTFALTYAAVTLRLWLGVMMGAQALAGVESRLAFDRAYHVVPFLAWVPNVLVAEWLIDRSAATGRVENAAAAPTPPYRDDA